MSKVIRIDDQVYEALQKAALDIKNPFMSPNMVLRIRLGLDKPAGETLENQQEGGGN